MARGSVVKRKGKNGITYWMKLELPKAADSPRKTRLEKCGPEVKTEVQARKAATIRQAEIERAGIANLTTVPLSRYLTEHVDRGVSFGEYRPATERKYRTQIMVIGKAPIGSQRMDRITNADVRRFLDSLIAVGRTPYTVNQYGTFLRMVFKAAVGAKQLPDNPMNGVRLPPAKARPQDVLTREEAYRLLAVARRDSYWPLWLFFLYTGVRIGEVLAVRWEDLDLARRALRIVRALDITHKDGPTKTPSGVRVIYYPDDLAVELALHRVEQQERAPGQLWRDNDLIFPDQYGEFDKPQRVRERLYRLCAEAGITKVSPHDLRRTTSTLLGAEGASPRSVATMLGHANVSETLNTYTLASDRLAEDTAGRLGRLFKPSGDNSGD